MIDDAIDEPTTLQNTSASAIEDNLDDSSKIEPSSLNRIKNTTISDVSLKTNIPDSFDPKGSLAAITETLSVELPLQSEVQPQIGNVHAVNEPPKEEKSEKQNQVEAALVPNITPTNANEWDIISPVISATSSSSADSSTNTISSTSPSSHTNLSNSINSTQSTTPKHDTNLNPINSSGPIAGPSTVVTSVSKRRPGRPRKSPGSLNTKHPYTPRKSTIKKSTPLIADLSSHQKTLPFRPVASKPSATPSITFYSSEVIRNSPRSTKAAWISPVSSPSFPIKKRGPGRPRKSEAGKIALATPKPPKRAYRKRIKSAPSTVTPPSTDSTLTSLSESDFASSSGQDTSQTPNPNPISIAPPVYAPNPASASTSTSTQSRLEITNTINANSSTKDNSELGIVSSQPHNGTTSDLAKSNVEPASLPVKKRPGRPRKSLPTNPQTISFTETTVSTSARDQLPQAQAANSSIALKRTNKTFSNPRTPTLKRGPGRPKKGDLLYGSAQTRRRVGRPRKSNTDLLAGAQTDILIHSGMHNTQRAKKPRKTDPFPINVYHHDQIAFHKQISPIKRSVGRPRKNPVPTDEEDVPLSKSLGKHYKSSVQVDLSTKFVNTDLESDIPLIDQIPAGYLLGNKAESYNYNHGASISNLINSSALHSTNEKRALPTTYGRRNAQNQAGSSSQQTRSTDANNGQAISQHHNSLNILVGATTTAESHSENRPGLSLTRDVNVHQGTAPSDRTRYNYTSGSHLKHSGVDVVNFSRDPNNPNEPLVKKKRPVGRPRKSEAQIAPSYQSSMLSKNFFEKRQSTRPRKTISNLAGYSSDGTDSQADSERGSYNRDSLREADEIASIIKTKKKREGKSVDLHSIYTSGIKNADSSPKSRISEDLEYFTGIKRGESSRRTSPRVRLQMKTKKSINNERLTKKEKEKHDNGKAYNKAPRLGGFRFGNAYSNLTESLVSKRSPKNKRTKKNKNSTSDDDKDKNENGEFRPSSSDQPSDSDASFDLDVSDDSDPSFQALSGFSKTDGRRKLVAKSIHGRKQPVGASPGRLNQAFLESPLDSLENLNAMTLDGRFINMQYLHEFEAHNVVQPWVKRIRRKFGHSFNKIPKYNRGVYGDVPLMRVASSDSSWEIMHSLCSWASESDSKSLINAVPRSRSDVQANYAAFFEWKVLKHKITVNFFQKSTETIDIKISNPVKSVRGLKPVPKPKKNQTKLPIAGTTKPLRTDLPGNSYKLGQLEYVSDNAKLHVANTGINIMALDWAPQTIHEKSFLAVGGIKKQSENQYVLGIGYVPQRPNASNNVIQIWEHDPAVKLLKCSLLICHNRGPVWALSWCPLRPADNVEDFNFLENITSFIHNMHKPKRKKVGRPSLKEKASNSMPANIYEHTVDANEFNFYDSAKYSHIGLLAAVFGDGSAGIFSVPNPEPFYSNSSRMGDSFARHGSNYPVGISLPKLVLDIRLPETTVGKLIWIGCDRVMIFGNDGSVSIWSISDAIMKKAQYLVPKNQDLSEIPEPGISTASGFHSNLDIHLMPLLYLQPHSFPVAAADIFPPNISASISVEQKESLVKNKVHEQIEASKSQVKGVVAHLSIKDILFSIGNQNGSLTIDTLSSLHVNSTAVVKSTFWRNPLIWSSSGLLYLYNDTDWLVKATNSTNIMYVRNFYNSIGRDLIQRKKLEPLDRNSSDYSLKLKQLVLETEEIDVVLDSTELGKTHNQRDNARISESGVIKDLRGSKTGDNPVESKISKAGVPFLDNGVVLSDYLQMIYKHPVELPSTLSVLEDTIQDYVDGNSVRKGADQFNNPSAPPSVNKSAVKNSKQVPWGKDNITVDQLAPDVVKMLGLINKENMFQTSNSFSENQADFERGVTQACLIFHDSYIWTMAKSPVHKVIASTSADGTLLLTELPHNGIPNYFKRGIFPYTLYRLSYDAEAKTYEFVNENSLNSKGYVNRDIYQSRPFLCGIQVAAWHPSIGHSALLASGTAGGILRVDKVD